MTRDDAHYYNREKLYDEVWKEPMTVVSKRYGVSDVALAKTCGKLNIPRPYAGYWTQKECGKAPPRPELPEFDNPPQLLIHPPSPQILSDRRLAEGLNLAVKTNLKKTDPQPEPRQNTQGSKTAPEKLDHESEPPKKAPCWQDVIPKEGILFPQAFEDAVRLLEKESLPEMAVTMSQVTEKGNSYVTNTLHVLQKKITELKKYPMMYRYGRVKSYGKDLFEVDAGPESVLRAAGILKALCNAFEKRGFSLVSEWNEQNWYGHVSVVIMGEKIAFSITEQSIQTKTELKDKNDPPQCEYTPTGKLTIQNISPPLEMRGQYRWSDTKKIPLEERLNEVLIGFIIAAAWGREQKARQEKYKEDRAKEQAAREEKERLERIEKQRIINFEKGTERWIWHQEMTAFLSAVKKCHAHEPEKQEDTEKWIHWAEEYLTNHPAVSRNMIRYETGEYREPSTRSYYHQPEEEPYNYWKRPWYQKGVRR
jgi:hypothetical protein